MYCEQKKMHCEQKKFNFLNVAENVFAVAPSRSAAATWRTQLSLFFCLYVDAIMIGLDKALRRICDPAESIESECSKVTPSETPSHLLAKKEFERKRCLWLANLCHMSDKKRQILRRLERARGIRLLIRIFLVLILEL